LQKFDETRDIPIIFPKFINTAMNSWIPNIMSASAQAAYQASCGHGGGRQAERTFVSSEEPGGTGLNNLQSSSRSWSHSFDISEVCDVGCDFFSKAVVYLSRAMLWRR
jgi:hypothetical protein